MGRQRPGDARERAVGRGAGTTAPPALHHGPGWPTPHALTVDELTEVRDAFVAATAAVADRRVRRRGDPRGPRLPAQPVLSPLTNRVEYGGSREARMRFLEVVEAARAWPEDKPLFVRVSSVDASRDA